MSPDRPSYGELKTAAPKEGNGGAESVLHRGDFLNSDKPKLQTLNDLEGIASIQLPASWLEVKEGSQLFDSAMFKPSSKEVTQISYYSSRRPLDEDSLKTFSQTVNADLPTPRIIYSDKTQADDSKGLQTIKDLSPAFGISTVGDNQVTNPPASNPAFHLETATVEDVNGKKVIAVNGWFNQADEYGEIKMGEHGPLKRFYNGIFFQTEGARKNETRVKEFYLLADDQISFTSHKAVFRKALKSIEWK